MFRSRVPLCLLLLATSGLTLACSDSGPDDTLGPDVESHDVASHDGAASGDATSDGTPPPACPEGFASIPAGSFEMGSPADEEGRREDETQHAVTLTRNICLSATEVTQAQWSSLMADNPSRFDSCGGDCPVERVNWFEALLYANALSESEGLEPCYTVLDCIVDDRLGPECGSVSFVGQDCGGYRLPTEAEWEYAARAGDVSSRYGAIEDIAWYADNAEEQTHRVATLQHNDWGVYDMLGNVWEWVHDLDSDYSSTAVTDPAGPTYPADLGAPLMALLRGGGYGTDAISMRAAGRHASVLAERGPRNGPFQGHGFRVAKSN